MVRGKTVGSMKVTARARMVSSTQRSFSVASTSLATSAVCCSRASTCQKLHSELQIHLTHATLCQSCASWWVMSFTHHAFASTSQSSEAVTS